MYCRQRKRAYRTNAASPEHLDHNWESSLHVQGRNDQGLLMLVHPPAKGFFRREFWNLKGITRLPIRRETYFVRMFVIDADAHNIEIHNRAQLVRENIEQFLRRAN